MRIRIFREGDAKKLSYMIRRCIKETNSKDYSEKAIQFMVVQHSPKKLIENSKERQVYVAAEDDSLLGTASLKDGMAFTVFVNPRFHGRGIGRKLMGKIEKQAKRNGHNYMHLHSSLTAAEFYRKLGYKKIREKSEENIGRIIIMKKLL